MSMFKQFVILITIFFHPIRIVKSIAPFKVLMKCYKYGAINSYTEWLRFKGIWKGTMYHEYLEMLNYNKEYWCFICGEDEE